MVKSPSTARESMLAIRKNLSDSRSLNLAFDKSHDAALEAIAAKLNRLMGGLAVHEGSTYSPPTDATVGSREWCLLFENLQVELEQARKAHKEHKVQSRASEESLEESVRALETELDDRSSGGKLPVANFNMMNVEALSALDREGTVAFVTSSGLSCYFYLIQSPWTLLELAYQQHMGPRRDILEEISLLHELGMSSAEVAHCTAFRRTIPIVFGTGEKWYMLSEIPTPKDFHNFDASWDSSFSERLRKALWQTCDSTRHMINSSPLNGDVKELLTSMLHRSHDFIESMLSFMSNFYRSCVKSTGLAEDDSWDLVQRLTWVILRQLSDCCRHASSIAYGSACRTPKTAAAVMRSTLQMHLVMATYAKQHPWEKHPALQPHITQFLLPRLAMRDEVATLSRKVEALQKALAARQPSPPANRDGDEEDDDEEEDDNEEEVEQENDDEGNVGGGDDDDEEEVDNEESPGYGSILEDSCSVPADRYRQASRRRRRRGPRRRNGH